MKQTTVEMKAGPDVLTEAEVFKTSDALWLGVQNRYKELHDAYRDHKSGANLAHLKLSWEEAHKAWSDEIQGARIRAIHVEDLRDASERRGQGF